MSTKPQRSALYRKHREAKVRFPTRIVRTGGTKGSLSVGDSRAREAIEQRLGRLLSTGFRKMHTRYQWVFAEPRG